MVETYFLVFSRVSFDETLSHISDECPSGYGATHEHRLFPVVIEDCRSSYNWSKISQIYVDKSREGVPDHADEYASDETKWTVLFFPKISLYRPWKLLNNRYIFSSDYWRCICEKCREKYQKKSEKLKDPHGRRIREIREIPCNPDTDHLCIARSY